MKENTLVPTTLAAAPALAPSLPLDEARWEAWRERGRRRDLRSARDLITALTGLALLQLLAVAVFGPFDPRVATLLRWSIVLTTTLLCVRLYGSGEYACSLGFASLAVLYNPFFPPFGFSAAAERALVGCTALTPLLYLYWSRSRRKAVAAIATVTLALSLTAFPPPATAAPAPDLSAYRGFSLGATLPEVAKRAHLDPAQAKAVHTRPALIQELEWLPRRADPATRAEAVKSVFFRFYNGELFQIVVNYDSYETEGLTAEDVIDAISATYGPSRPVTASAETYVPYSIDGETLARWEDAQYRLDLIRFSYGPSFRLVSSARKSEQLARDASTEAARLDEREAPQREVERLAAEESLKRTKSDKARSANRPRFRP